MFDLSNTTKLTDWIYEIYKEGMRVPARVYTSAKMLPELAGDRSLEQLTNVATLPGIVSYALAICRNDSTWDRVSGRCRSDENVVDYGGHPTPTCTQRLLTQGSGSKEATDWTVP